MCNGLLPLSCINHFCIYLFGAEWGQNSGSFTHPTDTEQLRKFIWTFGDLINYILVFVQKRAPVMTMCKLIFTHHMWWDSLKFTQINTKLSCFFFFFLDFLVLELRVASWMFSRRQCVFQRWLWLVLFLWQQVSNDTFNCGCPEQLNLFSNMVGQLFVQITSFQRYPDCMTGIM